MAWTTPKTNWYGAVIGGEYVGDRFNAVDFNRIKNNLVCLHNLAIEIYSDFSINAIGEDKTTADFFYADEINKMEQNLDTINSNTLKQSYGTAPSYSDNGKTMDYQELNRLESAILDLYDKLTNQYRSRRMFQWNFGIKGGF